MGSADKSAPAKVPRPGASRPGGRGGAGKRPDPVIPSAEVARSMTVPVGGQADESKPGALRETQRSRTQQAKSPLARQPRSQMPTLPGGLELPEAVRAAKPAHRKRKLEPVPLPWQRPNVQPAKPDPAVLLVGADEKFLPAIESALSRHRVFVETTDLGTVVQTVVAAAPDLVMLMGDAARDCGNDVLKKLSEAPQSAVVPVVILDDDTRLDARLRAFRHGAAAVIPRSASVDAIADRVANLAREIPERHGSALGEVGDTTLEELVETLARQLRSGILSVSAGNGDQAEAVRLVLGQGRPLADLIEDFVKRARKHVLAAEPLHYEFDEHVSGTVQVLDAAHSEQQEQSEDLSNVRIALADADAARADNISQELRALGATVIVTDLNPSEVRFSRMRQVDPTILLIGESHVQGDGYELVRRMRQDTRLRWASLLVVRWDELWSESDAAPKSAVQRLAGTLAALAEPENSIRERARAAHGFDTRLEVTGPARCLRALTAAGSSIRVSVTNLRLTVELDLANKLVVGASAHSADDVQRFEAATALAAFLQLSSGRVSVEPVSNPATANVMTTIDVALNMADAEPPPIAPSLPVDAAEQSLDSIHPAPMLPVTGLEVPEAVPASPSAARTPLQPLGRFSEDPGAAAMPLPGPPRHFPKGIRPLTALLLVGLAVMQGLLVVVLLRAFTQRESAARPTAAASAGASTSKSARASPRSAPRPKSSAAEVPKPPRALVAAPDSVPFPVNDMSGSNAPTCEDQWGEEVPRSGEYPGAAYAQSRIANKWITRGDVDRAQHAYCLAVRWDSQNPGYLLGLGNLFLLRRDGDAALPYLKRALELKPESDRAQGLVGDALARTGKLVEAKAHWLSSAGYRPDETVKLLDLSQRELRRGEHHQKRHEWLHAERMFRRAAVMNPRSLEAVVGLSHSLNAQQDAQAALLWAKYAVSLDPRSAPARVELGDALVALGETEAAKVEWQEAQLLDPTDENARHRLRGD